MDSSKVGGREDVPPAGPSGAVDTIAEGNRPMISEAIRSKYTIPSRTLFEITTAEPHDIPPDDVLLGGGTSIVGSVDRKWIPCATCARPREVWCRRFEWELKPDVEYAGEK